MRILKKFLEILFPSHCLSCKKIISKNALFCVNCWPELQFITDPKCKICSHPFEDEALNNYDDLICSGCAIKKPNYDKLITVFRYNKLLQKIIAELKYHDQTFLAKKFAKILFDKSKAEIASCDFILAVPLYKKRLKTRKFNQSVLLIKALEKFSEKNLIKKKFYPDFLIRVKNTIPQVSLKRKQRQKNMRRAFEVNKKYHKLVLGKNFLLVDDVITTGSTVENCSKALKKLGAKEVTVLTLAKSVFGSWK